MGKRKIPGRKGQKSAIHSLLHFFSYDLFSIYSVPRPLLSDLALYAQLED